MHVAITWRRNTHWKNVRGNLENVQCGNNVLLESDNLFLMSRAKVLIGDNVNILKGVTIGVGAVIATSAVVTKNISPYSVSS